jgi:hypothetical protein
MQFVHFSKVEVEKKGVLRMFENLPGSNDFSKSHEGIKQAEYNKLLSGWVDEFIASGSKGLSYNEKILLNEVLIKKLSVFGTEQNKEDIILEFFLKSIKELEEENKKLKQSLASKKQKNMVLESKLKDYMNKQRSLSDELSGTHISTEKKDFESKMESLVKVSCKQQFIIKIISSLFIAFVVFMIDFQIFFMGSYNWNEIGKLQKTFIISSFPILLSLIVMVFFGSQKSAKIISAITAIGGLIAGIYKLF